MAEAPNKLEQLRQELDLLLDRVDGLNDPELLQLAQQLDRLVTEEMRKGLPAEEGQVMLVRTHGAKEGRFGDS